MIRRSSQKCGHALLKKPPLALAKSSIQRKEKYKGHGDVQMDTKQIPTSGVFNKHTNSMELKTKGKNFERFKKQANRITAVQEMKSFFTHKSMKARQ